MPNSSPSCAEVLLRLGIASREDLRDLAVSLAWVREQREAAEKAEADHEAVLRERRTQRWGMVYAVGATILGGILTWGGSHLAGHLF